MDKVLSFLFALLLLVACYLQPTTGVFLPVALLMLPGLALVWFGTEIGSWAGPTGRRLLRTPLAPTYVKLTGWAMLFLLPLIPWSAYYLRD